VQCFLGDWEKEREREKKRQIEDTAVIAVLALVQCFLDDWEKERERERERERTLL